MAIGRWILGIGCVAALCYGSYGLGRTHQRDEDLRSYSQVQPYLARMQHALENVRLECKTIDEAAQQLDAATRQLDAHSFFDPLKALRDYDQSH